MTITIKRTVNGNVHTFTFPKGMVDDLSVSISNEPDKIVMPAQGPAGNIGNDFNGVEKTITMQINIVDCESSVVSGTNAPNIQTIDQIKYWLESLCDGFQTAKEFSAPGEEYTVRGTGTTTINGVVYPASFDTTKVYVTGISYGKKSGNVTVIPATITLWVAGF